MVKKIIYIFLVSGVNYGLQSSVWRPVMFGVESALEEEACSSEEGLVRSTNTMPSTTGARRAELNLFQDSLWSGLDWSVPLWSLYIYCLSVSLCTFLSWCSLQTPPPSPLRCRPTQPDKDLQNVQILLLSVFSAWSQHVYQNILDDDRHLGQQTASKMLYAKILSDIW